MNYSVVDSDETTRIDDGGDEKQRQAEATQRLSQSFSAAPKGFLKKRQKVNNSNKKLVMLKPRRKMKQQEPRLTGTRALKPQGHTDLQNKENFVKKRKKVKKKRKGQKPQNKVEQEVMHTVSMSMLPSTLERLGQ